MLTRRRWLQIAVPGILLAGAGGLFVARRLRIRLRPITGRERAALARVTDLLIPADETPGALDLGIDRAIMREMQKSRWNARRAAEAVLWLDEEARAEGAGRFVWLAEPKQLSLLERMERMPAASVPGRVFRELRFHSMTEYYSRPESWPALGFAGPPQPAGFPDHAVAPVEPVT